MFRPLAAVTASLLLFIPVEVQRAGAAQLDSLPGELQVTVVYLSDIQTRQDLLVQLPLDDTVSLFGQLWEDFAFAVG